MKQIILTAVLFCAFNLSFSQDTAYKPGNDTAKWRNNNTKGKKESIKMKDGKVVLSKDGKTSELKKDMTLSNGSVVMADGSVKMKDGTEKMLQEGDEITMDGKWKNKKMEMDKTKPARDSMQ